MSYLLHFHYVNDEWVKKVTGPYEVDKLKYNRSTRVLSPSHSSLKISCSSSVKEYRRSG